MFPLRRSAALIRATARFYSQQSSKGVHAARLQFVTQLMPCKSPAKEEWERLRTRLLESKFLQIHNDALIMDLCRSAFNADTAMSYYQFLKESDYKIDAQTIEKYLHILSASETPLTKEQQKEVVELIERLKKEHPYMSTTMIKHCIQALCLTDHWMKAFDMFEAIEGSQLSVSVYNGFILAALRNQQIDIMFEYFEKSMTWKWMLIESEEIHEKYIEFAEEKGPKGHREQIERMFKFLHKYNVILSTSTFSKYVESCRKFDWSVKRLQVNDSGLCPNCSNKLEKLSISNEDYETLKHIIVDRLSLFPNYDLDKLPKELMLFRKFIARSECCHVVIDGLNLSYAMKGSLNMQLLSTMVDYFSNKGYNILIIGRKHLAKIPTFQKIREKAIVYLLHNSIGDDPYIIYAALAYGPDTKMVSRDLMRQHCRVLPTIRLQRLFKLWQNTRQYVLNEEKMTVHHPMEYKSCSYHETGHWHIACADYNVAENEYDYVLQWHCLSPPVNT